MNKELPAYITNNLKPAVIRREAPRKNQRVLVLPDIHLRPAMNGVPSGEDTETLSALQRYVANYSWNQVVMLGDLMDFDCISTHNINKLRLVEGRRIQRDYDHGNRFLDSWQRATPGAVWTLIEGNHDERIERYIDANPALEGSLEIEAKLDLKSRGIRWVRFWSKGEIYSIGNAHFGHGLYTNKYHAEKHAAEYGVCFFYGHCFDHATEVLTPRGWTRRTDLLTSDRVVTYNQSTKKLEYNSINSFTDYDSYPGCIRVKAQNVDLLVTDGHGLLDFSSGNSVGYVARDFASRCTRTFACAGEMARPPIPFTDDEIRLLVWVAADGHLENSRLLRFHLKKRRKIDRLSGLLQRLGISPHVSVSADGTTRIDFWAPEKIRRAFADWPNKVLPAVLRHCCREQAEVLLEEYRVTDGSATGPRSIQISTAKETEADLIQEIMVTNGFRCNKTRRPNGDSVLSVNRRPLLEVKPERFERVTGRGPMWCISVDNGTLLVRRNGKVCITQNTHDVQEMPKSLRGADKAIVGQSMGCLCRYDQPYMRGRPSKWQQAFGVFHFRPDGFFNHYVVNIFDHGFISPEGEYCK